MRETVTLLIASIVWLDGESDGSGTSLLSAEITLTAKHSDFGNVDLIRLDAIPEEALDQIQSITDEGGVASVTITGAMTPDSSAVITFETSVTVVAIEEDDERSNDTVVVCTATLDDYSESLEDDKAELTISRELFELIEACIREDGSYILHLPKATTAIAAAMVVEEIIVNQNVNESASADTNGDSQSEPTGLSDDDLSEFAI